MPEEHHKHVVIDQVKYRKMASFKKCTDREYHAQDNADVANKEVKMYCDINQLSKLTLVVHIQSLIAQGG